MKFIALAFCATNVSSVRKMQNKHIVIWFQWRFHYGAEKKDAKAACALHIKRMNIYYI